MNILVTGTAGFVGFHLVNSLTELENVKVFGIDNINTYYDINLKYARLAEAGISREHIEYNVPVASTRFINYTFSQLDITDDNSLSLLFETEKFDVVINLAAQAGVRYSLEHPQAYIQSNIVGFTNILECCRHNNVKHLIYASSSSVYGMNDKTPFCEGDNVDYPVSFYAATKKSNELMAHTYSHIFHLPTTGLRLFTVYGPWGRPDMAPMLFTQSIYAGETIKVFNHGDMLRDFTYVGDIVHSVIRLINKIPDGSLNPPFYRILNVGNSSPVKLLDFIQTLSDKIGIEAKLELLPMQPGDVKTTYADVSCLESLTGCHSHTRLEEGIEKFIGWYKNYREC